MKMSWPLKPTQAMKYWLESVESVQFEILKRHSCSRIHRPIIYFFIRCICNELNRCLIKINWEREKSSDEMTCLTNFFVDRVLIENKEISFISKCRSIDSKILNQFQLHHTISFGSAQFVISRNYNEK